MKATPKEYLKSLLFFLIPHHLVSWLAYHATRITWAPIKNRLIKTFLSLHDLDMSEALIANPYTYDSLNALFTRALKPEARPLAEGDDVLLCPVDGTVSQAGPISGGRVFQAKGRDYSLLELVGGDTRLAAPFENGRFATLYLSPLDYHRIHMPLAGRLTDMVYVPGRLFSVAPWTVRAVPRLFARNERLVCHFETDHGPLALVLVGAINVSAIDTVWSGPVTPPSRRALRHTRYDQGLALSITKGREMGRFNLGSTVIVLAGPNVQWAETLAHGASVRMGEALGRVTT